MSDEHRDTTLPVNVRWAIGSLLFAVALGVLWCLMAYLLREALLNAMVTPPLQAIRIGPRGPSILFFISAGLGGWIMGWLAERTWHSVGWHLLISTVVSAAIAFGVAGVFMPMVFEAVPPNVRPLLFASGFFCTITGAVSVWLRSVR